MGDSVSAYSPSFGNISQYFAAENSRHLCVRFRSSENEFSTILAYESRYDVITILKGSYEYVENPPNVKITAAPIVFGVAEGPLASTSNVPSLTTNENQHNSTLVASGIFTTEMAQAGLPWEWQDMTSQLQASLGESGVECSTPFTSYSAGDWDYFLFAAKSTNGSYNGQVLETSFHGQYDEQQGSFLRDDTKFDTCKGVDLV